MDPIWQRIILPATACLRLGILLALAAAPLLHVELSPAVELVACVVAAAYAVGYGLAWLGKVAPAALGYSVVLDSLLLGLLLGGSGPLAALVGFLCLVALALAHFCGGARLALAAFVAGAAGALAAHFVGAAPLVSAAAWQLGDFRFALQPEATYRGASVLAVSERQLLRAAVAAFFLVAASGCVALVRALWERRRVATACSEIDALEDIVDCYTSGASDEDLWRSVAAAAAILGKAPAMVACRGAQAIEFVAGTASVNDEAVAAVVRSRIPVTARDNLVARSIESGQEAQAADLEELTRGADGAHSSPSKRRKLPGLVVPVPGEEVALIALTRDRHATIDGLRIVAERAAMVRQARHRLRAAFDLEPAAAGA